MADHTPLRERERDEHTDRVERQHRLFAGVEDDDQQCGQQPENQNAVGEDKAVATAGELAREKAIARQDRGQSRKVRVARIGRKHQDEGCCAIWNRAAC